MQEPVISPVDRSDWSLATTNQFRACNHFPLFSLPESLTLPRRVDDGSFFATSAVRNGYAHIRAYWPELGRLSPGINVSGGGRSQRGLNEC